MTAPAGHRSAQLYSVDRIENGIAVLVGNDAATVEVSKAQLPGGTREGSVVRVPLGADGRPDWPAAVLDDAERERRLRDALDRLERLAGRDPGGDVTL